MSSSDAEKRSLEQIEGDDTERGLPRHDAAGKEMDEAAKVLHQSGGTIEYTLAESKRVLRLVDLWVCVPMCIVYCVQQMDKQSVSYAAVFDLQKETGLHGTQYSWLTSVVYIAQLCFQPLSSYALIVFPVKWWVIFNYFSWSVVTLCTAAAHNFSGLLVARLFLGIFEATILPSFVFITQMWWTRREQSYRTIAYQIANSFAAIIGPLMSWGIGHVHSGIRPYQGIFLFIGSVSMTFVPVVAYMMPNSPATARFLNKGNDRVIAIQRLRENNTGTKTSKINWDQVWETFRDPKTWMWAFMYLSTSIPSGGIGAFGGLITKGFGFKDFDAVLMQMPTGVIGIITLLISIYCTNKWKRRFPIILVLIIFAIAGATAITQIQPGHPGALLAAYYVLFPFSGIQPLLYSWANLNAAGTTKRVVTTATMFVFQCAGNVIGPQVYLAKEAPHYHTGLYVDMACWSLLFILTCSMAAYLTYLNKQQEKKRVALGLPSELRDISLMDPEEADKYKLELSERLKSAKLDHNRIFENAFDDLTDFQNPMFMYVI